MNRCDTQQSDAIRVDGCVCGAEMEAISISRRSLFSGLVEEKNSIDHSRDILLVSCCT